MPKSKKQDNHTDLFVRNRLIIFAKAASYTLGALLILGGGGYLVDQWLGTSPVIFITGLAAAYPATQILLYKKIKKLGNKKLKEITKTK